MALRLMERFGANTFKCSPAGDLFGSQPVIIDAELRVVAVVADAPHCGTVQREAGFNSVEEWST